MYRAATVPASLQPVSVIICARNEGANLRQNLPAILQQTAPNPIAIVYEVVVINDGSDDNTLTVLQMLAAIYPHLSFASIPTGGKKAALRHALTVARYNHLLFTDADCRPGSPHWLYDMCTPLNTGYDIVAGYGAYEPTPQSLLNRCIQWETMHTWWQYSGYISAGRPYMAVGRNMACTRTIALQAIQHPLWNSLPYGDDDLLLAVTGTGARVTAVATHGSETISAPKKTWDDWVRQKQRHLSTGKYYRLPIRFALGAYAVSHAGMWLFIPAMFFASTFPALVAVAILPLLLQWLVVKLAGNRFYNHIPLWQWVAGSMAWVLYNFTFLPYIAWKNKTNWT
jgi:glycosyltransferase involved in cell wall biosynthesis